MLIATTPIIGISSTFDVVAIIHVHVHSIHTCIYVCALVLLCAKRVCGKGTQVCILLATTPIISISSTFDVVAIIHVHVHNIHTCIYVL